MKILVACEESQAVTIELRKLGHEAYSCDIEPCSGGHPEWHLQQDVTKILSPLKTWGEECLWNGIYVDSQNGEEIKIPEKWDMIISFPPCTHLAVSGARHFAAKIADGRQQEGIDFFMKFANADCDKIAIENPVGIMSSKWRKPNQIIQPYEYGDPHKKTTCLWTKGLPNLIPTNIVDICDLRTYKCKNGKEAVFSDWINKGGKERQKNRSKTFPGIAKAMAEQWTK